MVPPCLKHPKNSGLTLLIFKQKYRLWKRPNIQKIPSLSWDTSLNTYYHGIEHRSLKNSKETALLKKNEVFHEATSFPFCTLELLWINSTSLEFHPLHFYHHHEECAWESTHTDKTLKLLSWSLVLLKIKKTNQNLWNGLISYYTTNR